MRRGDYKIKQLLLVFGKFSSEQKMTRDGKVLQHRLELFVFSQEMLNIKPQLYQPEDVNFKHKHKSTTVSRALCIIIKFTLSPGSREPRQLHWWWVPSTESIQNETW